MKTKITSYIKVIGIFLVFFVSPNLTKATHIVGGEMTYTCLGDDEYLIELTIFRDCWNGNPNAYFDDPAAVGIYNNSGDLLEGLLIDWDEMLDDTLDPVLADPCLVVPPNVCVHTTKYSQIVTLPPIIGGYELIYQRCCRNVTIVNIVDPLASGATFGVTISETALLECNSSAKFAQWPPIYICANEPIDFDQSATDVDGDSIVYRLCTPLLGADQVNPQPQPNEQTVPTPVVWVDPPYSESNMLNGDGMGQFLEIDPVTGLLTGVPNTIGQFVVGICVEEYRDGVLISTTSRDFQFNVGICGQTISSIFTPDVICNNELLVCPENNSINADDFEWYWNDPAWPDSVSYGSNPCHMYSDTGNYIIMMIAEPLNPCVDTSYQDIYLQYESLTADFNFEFVECSDSLVVQATDLSIDTISNPGGWLWELLDENGDVIGTSTDQNPVFSVFETQTVTLQLIVISDNECQDTIEQMFFVDLLDEMLFADTVSICIGDSLQLNPDPNPSYFYDWSPPGTLSDPSAGNPWAYPTATTTYEVYITDADSLCELNRAITVILPPPIVIDVANDTTICSPDYELSAFSEQGVQYFWATDPEINDIFANTASTTVTPIGETTYYVMVRDSLNCPKIDSITIIGNGVNVETEDVNIICDGETAEIWVQGTDGIDILTYNWVPNIYVLSGAMNDTALVQPPGPGTWYFYVELENQFGCTLIDSVEVGVLDTTPQAAFVNGQQCGGYTIQFTNESVNAPYVIWDFGDPSNPTATSTEENPEYTYPGPGLYTVTLAVNADVNCPDTIEQVIQVMEPLIIVDFQWNFDECSDSVVISFTDISTNLQSNIISWDWQFSNGDASNLQNPTIVINQSQILEITLTIVSDDGCEDTFSQVIPINLINVALQDTVLSCFGIETALNPGGNSTYEYQWSPATGLNNPTDPNPMANPEVTTTYSVTVSDFTTDTCQVVHDITVVVPPIIEMTVSNDTMICASDIIISAESMQASTFTWSEFPDFSVVLSEDQDVLVTPAQPTTYYVQVVDDFGCTLENSVTVFGYEISASVPDYTVCVGDTIMIEVQNPDMDQDLTFNWTPSAEIIEGGMTGTPTVSPDMSVLYSTVVSNQYGCSTTLESQVDVFNFVPPLSATADPDTILIGQSSQLDAMTDNSSYSYQWFPATTLDDPTIPNPIATPTETTDYTVAIENGDGCSNFATIRVVVLVPICDDPFIFFPNAFTPNDDGENDVLKVYGEGIDEVYWVIYNRWGQKVFESKSVDEVWNGTYDGKELPPDVFGYYLEVKCFGGQEFFKKGNVTLLK